MTWRDRALVNEGENLAGAKSEHTDFGLMQALSLRPSEMLYYNIIARGGAELSLWSGYRTERHPHHVADSLVRRDC